MSMDFEKFANGLVDNTNDDSFYKPHLSSLRNESYVNIPNVVFDEEISYAGEKLEDEEFEEICAYQPAVDAVKKFLDGLEDEY